jgi:hypothetical protein
MKHKTKDSKLSNSFTLNHVCKKQSLARYKDYKNIERATFIWY